MLRYFTKPINLKTLFMDFIKSNEDLALAYRKDDVLYGILDQYTGEEMTLSLFSGTPTVDSIIYFQLGTEYFKRVLASEINVKWFGAMGNDLNDDTSSFENALLSGSDQKAILTIPPGTYRITSTLTLPEHAKVKGSGIGSTFINYRGTGACFFSDAAYPETVAICDIKLNGEHKTSERTGIKVSKTWGAGIIMSRIVLEGFETGMDVGSAYNSSFSHIIARDSHVGIKYVGYSAADFNNVNVFNNVICISNTVGIVISNSQNTKFNECNWEGNNFGISIYGSFGNISFDNCWTEMNAEGFIVPCELNSSYEPSNTGIIDPNRLIFNNSFVSLLQKLIPDSVTIRKDWKDLSIANLQNKDTSEDIAFLYGNYIPKAQALFNSPWNSDNITHSIATYANSQGLKSLTVGKLTLTGSNGSIRSSHSFSVVSGKKYVFRFKYRVTNSIGSYHDLLLKCALIEVGTGTNVGETIGFGFGGEKNYFSTYSTVIEATDSATIIPYIYVNGTVGDMLELCEVLAYDITEVFDLGYGYNDNWISQNILYVNSGELVYTGKRFIDLDSASQLLTDFVTKSTAQDITATKTYKETQVFQGDRTGTLPNQIVILSESIPEKGFYLGLKTSTNRIIAQGLWDGVSALPIDLNPLGGEVTVPVATAPSNAVNLGQVNSLKKENILNIVTNYTISLADFINSSTLVLYCDATSGSFTLTLPNAAAFAGHTIHVVLTSNTLNTVTLQTTGSELINASSTFAFTGQYKNITLKSNGAKFFLI